jgi:hypothetical protein
MDVKGKPGALVSEEDVIKAAPLAAIILRYFTLVVCP